MSATDAVLAFGDIVVDTRAHRVTRSGGEVPLEPPEAARAGTAEAEDPAR